MNRDELKAYALSLGMDFFGVADLAAFADWPTDPPELPAGHRRAISMGLALNHDILDALTDGPTPHYSNHYQVVNGLLDQAAFQVARYLTGQGYRSVPIPASQILDFDQWRAAISHKAVARMAGLGWQGKSLLLVNPEVGPRLRLVTVLTDADPPPDEPLANRCGSCTECADACPAGAIKGVPFGQGYSDRSEAWDADACSGLLINVYGKRPQVTPLICGICVQVCPFGRSGRQKAARLTPRARK
jgi:epoxyqueuosine reductase QueG